jgi:Flp pilus assembly pilin Flp
MEESVQPTFDTPPKPSFFRISMPKLLNAWIRKTEAQEIIEYALLAAFISICAVAVFLALGGDVRSVYGGVSTASAAASRGNGEPPPNPGGGNGNPGGGNGNTGGGNGNPGGGNGNPGGGGNGKK